MQRYYFDFDDGCNRRDEEGALCADLQAAILEAKKALPAIAAQEVMKYGERQAITLLVTDENGRSVYVAALSYTGTLLIR